MKILYVIHSLTVGGAECLVVNYLLKMKERGENVSLIEISHEDTFLSERVKNSGIPYFTLLKHNIIERVIYRLFPSLFAFRFKRVIKEIDPDVIHYQTVYRFIERLSFPINRCVFTFHARVERCLNIGPFVRPLLERLSEKGLYFIAISSKVKDDILQFFPSANTVMIPNGVNLSDIKKNRQDKSLVRKELGIADDAFVVGQVGRFNVVKNHLFTLDVFRIIMQRNDKAILVLIGDGSEEEKEPIMNRIKQYNLEQKVLFLGLRDDATKLMCSFDALIHPSFSESFSLVLIEAQANGIRCVASDEIPHEVICNDNCIQLSLSESFERWADVILGNLNIENTSDINQFDLRTVIESHISLYNSLVNNCNSLSNENDRSLT